MAQTTVPPPDHQRSGPPVGRIVLTVVGALAVLLALVLGAVGGILLWAHSTQRDADGFFTSDTGRLETLTHAITSEEIDLGARPGERDRRFDLGDVATVRLTVDPEADEAVFVGIGPEDDVARYLDGVAHAEVTDLDIDPFKVTYRFSGGGPPDEPPGQQEFWAAAVEGSGPQTLEWDLESGQWSVVLMNADGSAGVGVDASVGVQADWIFPVSIGLLVAFAVLLLGGAAVLVFGVVGIARHTEAQEVPAPTVAGPYPLRLEGRLDLPLSRWLWLVKWLLLIPHFVILVALWIAFSVVTVVAGVAILFTGRYPRSLFDFNAGVLRWTWRVVFYSFGAFATDRYPPFTFREVPDHPATLQLVYPEQLSRGLVLVKWWLLAIPHYVVLGILGGGLVIGWNGGDESSAFSGPGLVGWLVLVAAVALLFAGRYPPGIFDFAMGLNRWVYRVIAYAALMTDEYPPFRLDQGGTEPEPSPPSQPEGGVPPASGSGVPR